MTEIYADIHSHILPGVDDGSRDMGQTMRMLDIAYREGIRLLFLTPHYTGKRYAAPFSEIREVFRQVEEAAGEKYPGLRLELGREIFIGARTVGDIGDGVCGTMAGTRHVLVEEPPGTDWKDLYQDLRWIANSGYQVILAHVERYGCLANKEERIMELADAGVLLQMNASAIVRHGLGQGSPSTVSKWNRRLVTGGYVSFLGSDAHDERGRAPLMRKCAQWVRKRLPERDADALLYGNARELADAGGAYH